MRALLTLDRYSSFDRAAWLPQWLRYKARIGVTRLTLTTHAIVGAAIVSVMPAHPPLAIAAAFASHFLLDAIPHWDYPIRSDSVNPLVAATMKYDRALLTDMLTIGADAILGIGLALFLLARPSNLALVFCGAGAAILPDALQFAYMRFPREPLITLQRFHSWMHASRSLHARPSWGCSLKSPQSLSSGLLQACHFVPKYRSRRMHGPKRLSL